MPDPVTKHLLTKTKEAIRAYLESLALPELNGYHFSRGLRTGLQKLPTVIVAVGGLKRDMESESSPLKCAMVAVFIETRAVQDNDRVLAGAEDAHDAAASVVYDALSPVFERDTPRAYHVAALRAFANSENTTSRPVTGFWLGQFLEPEVVTGYDPERKTYLSKITLEKVPVMNNDGD